MASELISAVIEFLQDRFALSSLKVIRNINGKRFTELTPLQRRKIEDYQIDICTIQPPTPEQIKFNVFDRVNRGGTKLNSQEMRNALYQGAATRLIDDLSALEIFKKATAHSVSPERMKDKYIILRFIAFYLAFYLEQNRLGGLRYKGSIDEFLAEAMAFLNTASDTGLIGELRLIFTRAMQFACGYGEDVFRFANKTEGVKRPINMALFESLTYLFALCGDYGEGAKTPTKEEIEALKKEFEESGKFHSGSDSTPNVEYRFGRAREFVKEFAAKNGGKND